MILVDIINLVFGAFYVLLLAQIVLSWVRPDPWHPTWGPIIRFINGVIDPILNPIRRVMPPLGGLDFSPMIVLILARVLQGFLINLVV
ncbi:MAG TPA: YggT family protein [Promineifilum sp.]|nr:YggT family protein [Promineifilum sp.]HRO24633.1 YggT family protein [Promineifilum sp.]HRO91922.1 YggT family protein [Promineifilum sp.]HRQ15335.1 YggT family protein [Promineifilum sp.]